MKKMEEMTMKNMEDNHPIVRSTRMGDITFHSNGRIDITAHVARTLDLKPGDVVNIAAIGGYCMEYYLYVAKRKEQVMGRHACTCRNVKNNGHYLRVFSKPMAQFIISLCHEEKCVSLRVGARETIAGMGPALPLITRQMQGKATY